MTDNPFDEHTRMWADDFTFGTDPPSRRALFRLWLYWRWHLLRYRGRWELHSYGCDACVDR